MSYSFFYALVMTFVISFFLSFSAFAEDTGTPGVLVGGELLPPRSTSQWGVSFFSIGSIGQKQIERGGGSFSSYNYLGLNYRLDSKQKLSFRPVFYYNTAGYNKFNGYDSQNVAAGDHHFVYSNYNLGNFDNTDIILNFKIYLPSSEASQLSGMVAKIRPETIIEKEVGRYSAISYVAKPDIYIQSQTNYITPPSQGFVSTSAVGAGSPNRRATQIATLEHYIEFSQSLNSILSINPAVGFKEEWFHPLPNEGSTGYHSTLGRLALALEIRPMRGSSFTFGIENKPRLANLREDVKFFRPEDNEATLMINASM